MSSPKKDLTAFIHGPGYEQIDANVLQQMDDAKLEKVCRVNKYTANICKNQEFWRIRLSDRLGFDLYEKGIDYAKIYRDIALNSENRAEIAIKAAKFGYNNILETILNEYNFLAAAAGIRRRSPHEMYVSFRSFGLGNIHVRMMYSNAISSGNVGGMLLIEEKYLPTSEDIIEVLYETYHKCERISPDAVAHLLEKEIMPPIDVYVWAAKTGSVSLMDELLEQGISLPSHMEDMLVAAVYSGSREISRRVLELYDEPLNDQYLVYIVSNLEACLMHEKRIDNFIFYLDTLPQEEVEIVIDNLLNWRSLDLLSAILKSGHAEFLSDEAVLNLLKRTSEEYFLDNYLGNSSVVDNLKEARQLAKIILQTAWNDGKLQIAEKIAEIYPDLDI